MPQILDNTPLLLFKKYILMLLCAQEKPLWGRGGKGAPHRVNPALHLKKQEGSCPAKERWEAALWTWTVYVSGNYFPSASWGCLQESRTLPDYHSPWGVPQEPLPSRMCPRSVSEVCLPGCVPEVYPESLLLPWEPAFSSALPFIQDKGSPIVIGED